MTEQSSMDLLYPARLVFHYERLMSLAFAMVERPVTALLLGVGGAAMWRFVRAYLVRGGVRDGFPGLFVAATGAFYVFLRWAKVRERWAGTRLDPPPGRS